MGRHKLPFLESVEASRVEVNAGIKNVLTTMAVKSVGASECNAMNILFAKKAKSPARKVHKILLVQVCQAIPAIEAKQLLQQRRAALLPFWPNPLGCCSRGLGKAKAKNEHF